MAVAQSSCDNSTICYVLIALWMTAYFHVIGKIQIQVWNLRCSELFIMIHQVAPLNCASGAKSSIVDCFVSMVIVQCSILKWLFAGDVGCSVSD